MSFAFKAVIGLVLIFKLVLPSAFGIELNRFELSSPAAIGVELRVSKKDKKKDRSKRRIHPKVLEIDPVGGSRVVFEFNAIDAKSIVANLNFKPNESNLLMERFHLGVKDEGYLPNVPSAKIAVQIKLPTQRQVRKFLGKSDGPIGLKTKVSNLVQYDVFNKPYIFEELGLSIDCASQISACYEKGVVSLKFHSKNLASCIVANSNSADAFLNPLFLGKRLRSTLVRNTEEAIKFGEGFRASFLKLIRGYVVSKTHPATQYLQKLMEKIVRNSDVSWVKPSVFLLNIKEVNASVTPSGMVFVNRGLLEEVKSEAELIAVLAHEWAHFVADHSRKQIKSDLVTIAGFGVASLAAVLGTNAVFGPKAAESVAFFSALFVGIGGLGLKMAENLRSHETEADLLGMQYLWAAGYHPWSASQMFELLYRIEYANRGGESLNEVDRSHPLPRQRFSKAVTFASLFLPSKQNYIWGYEELGQAKDSLSDLPPANTLSGFQQIPAEKLKKEFL